MLSLHAKHGEFKQLPTHHLKGSGCPKCADEQTSLRFKMTHDEFMKKNAITNISMIIRIQKLRVLTITLMLFVQTW